MGMGGTEGDAVRSRTANKVSKPIRPRSGSPSGFSTLKTNGAVPHADKLGDGNDSNRDEREQVFALIQRYSHASWGRAWFELAHSLALYAILWTYQDSWIACILASWIRVRLFIVFHDMAHDAFFPNSTVNVVVGTVVGIINHTPLSFWRRGHNHHHRHSNNTHYEQYSQSNPWTLETWNKAKWWQKSLYRFSFSPLGFLLVVPSGLFGLFFRIMSKWYEHVLYFSYLAACWYFDSLKFELWTFVLAGIPAVLLFHVQHTFPGAKRYKSKDWSFYENGMAGSSFLQVPWFLSYFTGNIQYHHIHHLSPLVPLYRLPACHKAGGELFDRVPRATFADAFRWLHPMVWDSAAEEFVKV